MRSWSTTPCGPGKTAGKTSHCAWATRSRQCRFRWPVCSSSSDARANMNTASNPDSRWLSPGGRAEQPTDARRAAPALPGARTSLTWRSALVTGCRQCSCGLLRRGHRVLGQRRERLHRDLATGPGCQRSSRESEDGTDGYARAPVAVALTTRMMSGVPLQMTHAKQRRSPRSGHPARPMGPGLAPTRGRPRWPSSKPSAHPSSPPAVPSPSGLGLSIATCVSSLRPGLWGIARRPLSPTPAHPELVGRAGVGAAHVCGLTRAGRTA